MRIPLLLAVWLVAASAAACPQAALAPAQSLRADAVEMSKRFEDAAGSPATTLFLGDSIVHGWRWQAEALSQPSVAAGVGGDKIETLLWRLERRAISWSPQNVVLMIGTNNLARSEPCAISQGLVSLVTVVRQQAPGAKIFVTTILPRGPYLQTHAEKIAAVNQELRRLGEAGGFHVIDTFTPVAARCSGAEKCELFADQLHPTREGYRVIGAAIQAALEAPAAGPQDRVLP
jgi:hypothetical protein